MERTKGKKQQRIRRKRRTRAKIRGTSRRPRLTVFRSNRHLYVQLIDDEAGKTLAAASDRKLEVRTSKKKALKLSPLEQARALGSFIAVKAKKAGLTQAVFDRGHYAYHGIVKSLAEGAREGGLKL